MTTPGPESGVVGTMYIEHGKGTVRMEDIYDTAIADLWSALTDPERLARWVCTVTGDLRPRGQFQARFSSTWEDTGRVDSCEEPIHLVTTLNPGSGEETVIEATLTAEGGRTRLVLEERGFPLGEVAAHGAGWQVHIEDLGSHLNGRQPGSWRNRWIELTPHYEELAKTLA